MPLYRQAETPSTESRYLEVQVASTYSVGHAAALECSVHLGRSGGLEQRRTSNAAELRYSKMVLAYHLTEMP